MGLSLSPNRKDKTRELEALRRENQQLKEEVKMLSTKPDVKEMGVLRTEITRLQKQVAELGGQLQAAKNEVGQSSSIILQ